MDMKLNVAFFSNGRLTFSVPDAEANRIASVRMLENVFGRILTSEELLTAPEMVGKFADTLTQPDLIIYQCTTFIGADFMTEITRRFKCPIAIWSVREPSIDGGRLKLNSLTGAFSAGNCLFTQGIPFRFVFGNPEDTTVVEQFKKIEASLMLIKKLQSLVIGVVGIQPPGFSFGAIDQSLLSEVFGIRLVQTEAAEIMKEAAALSSEEYLPVLSELKNRSNGLDKIPSENQEKYARLRKAYQNFIDRNGIQAIASRCWPDFFTGFGAPVCAVLSMLNDNGIPASCETDLGGVITMFIASAFSKGSVYFGDPVAVDESCDGIVFWHCGAGATCLSRKKEGAGIGVHPNRKIGPTMEFGLQAGEVTVVRLGKGKNGFRFFAMHGEALDEPQKFFGTSVVVRPAKGNASGKVREIAEDGWEPHFVVAYGDIMEELKMFCQYLSIELIDY